MKFSIPEHLQNEDQRNLYCLVLVASQCLEMLRKSQPEAFKELNSLVLYHCEISLVDANMVLNGALEILQGENDEG